jgi:hypothetical protein
MASAFAKATAGKAAMSASRDRALRPVPAFAGPMAVKPAPRRRRGCFAAGEPQLAAACRKRSSRAHWPATISVD